MNEQKKTLVILPDSKTERIAITANHPENILFVNKYKVMKEKIFESEYSPQLTSGFRTFLQTHLTTSAYTRI